ncbi:MAG: hypothetical protein ACRCVJ_16955 [Clostridium sp.]|uniref:hypothetical protein n=1 Tax=Clostridium sp. TaxID=1506 RepID=UPI003F2AD39E
MAKLISAEYYLNNVINSLILNHKNTTEIYKWKEGALKLAKEVGVGLRDYNTKHQDEIVLKSYEIICVRFYQLNPPIRLNEWCSTICLSL